MRRMIAITMTLCLAGALTANDKKELEKLAGKWQPVEMRTVDNKIPEDQLKGRQLIIEGDKYSVTLNGKAIDAGTLKIDAKTKPKMIDITGTDGPNKGKTIPSIYDLDSEMLVVCYALEGAKRPTDFKATGDKILLIKYKKIKDEKKK